MSKRAGTRKSFPRRDRSWECYAARAGERTWKHDLKLVIIKPRWHLILPSYRDFLQRLCIRQ